MKDKICKILGENIKKYRKLRGLTQEKLAELIELEIRTYIKRVTVIKYYFFINIKIFVYIYVTLGNNDRRGEVII